MGVYIKGLEMPKEGTFNIVHIYDDGHVSMPFWGKGMQIVSGITAVHVPPHGRLIDADKMKGSVRKQSSFLKLMGGDLAKIAETLEKGTLQEIDNAPTVIPAEEGDT